jgi:hypothetical protein
MNKPTSSATAQPVCAMALPVLPETGARSSKFLPLRTELQSLIHVETAKQSRFIVAKPRSGSTGAAIVTLSHAFAHAVKKGPSLRDLVLQAEHHHELTALDQ